MIGSGIYIVRLLNDSPMPVTRDPRYVNGCAKVNKNNIKIGKAQDFKTRYSNYCKDFDKHNVIFEPLASLLKNGIQAAEVAIFKRLKPYRKLSPKGGKLEWLKGISYEKAKAIVFDTLDTEGIEYSTKK